MSADVQITLRVGDCDLQFTEGSWRSAIDELATADLLAHIEGRAPDWWSVLELIGEGQIAFSGSVVSAEPAQDGVRVSAVSGVEMTERLMGVAVAEDFPVQDIVYAAARASGFSRERMEIHGLGELLCEPIEIVVPLEGVEVHRRMEFGDVVLLPPRDGIAALAPFRNVPEEVRADWDEKAAFALVIRDSKLLADAEAAGVEAIDAVLAWLTMRVRYGYALLPDGSRSRFDRAAARTLPARVDSTVARGLGTGRRWVRDSTSKALRGSLELPGGDLLWPPLPDRLSTGDRLSLSAARDAASSEDAVQRATAIAVAWEFYCADALPPAPFTMAELARLRRELPDWLSADQAARLKELLGMANLPSLNRRLRQAFSADGVPVSDEEWACLQRVRRVRNRAAHGSETLEINETDLDLALSLLSRALVFRAARRSRTALSAHRSESTMPDTH